jgi:hypothetical protein
MGMDGLVESVVEEGAVLLVVGVSFAQQLCPH